MPRVNLNNRDREQQLFSDFVRGQLRRERKRQEDLSEFLGIPQSGLSRRMDGQIPWRLEEIADICSFFEKPWTVGERYG